ncbi:MAG: cytosine deaminase [Planctomycetota bacterium]
MGWIELPANDVLLLRHVRIPAVLLDHEVALSTLAAPLRQEFVETSIGIRGGKVVSIGDAELPPTASVIDVGGAILTPAFVDCHTHLDKCHIVSRCAIEGGDLHAAIDAVEQDKRHWTRDDLRRRAEFGLRTAYAHGVRAMRSHVDVRREEEPAGPPADAVDVLAELREAWADRIELQLATLTPIDDFADETWARGVADRAAEHGLVLGAFCYMTADFDALIARILMLAADRGLDVDFHVDETLDPDADGLARIAEEVVRQNFPRRVLCGHACSLAAMDEATAREHIELVAKAGLHVVTLPLTNLYLQDRQSGQQTPRRRGLTLVHELRAAGVAVSIATDNVRDPFFPYGDFDPLEAFREATLVGHLDSPVTSWLDALTHSPANAMGLQWDGRLRVGSPADLILWNARDDSELIGRPHGDRVVLRGGAECTAEGPDYRELDLNRLRD